MNDAFFNSAGSGEHTILVLQGFAYYGKQKEEDANMYTVAKVIEREIETLGTFIKKEDSIAILKQDFKKEFRKTFEEDYLENESEGEFDCGFDSGYESAWLNCGYNMAWQVLDCRLNFYYSFGSADFYPFRGGWVIVKAGSRVEADRIFMKHFPCRTPNLLNCASVYNEKQWREMAPEINWKGDQCHGVFED